MWPGKSFFTLERRRRKENQSGENFFRFGDNFEYDESHKKLISLRNFFHPSQKKIKQKSSSKLIVEMNEMKVSLSRRSSLS